MPVVSTMILRSMRLIGEKARGETLDTNEQVECLAELNTMMESMSNVKLLCYTQATVSTALSTSTSSYTIGPGGAIAVDRPLRLADPCYVRDTNTLDFPLVIVGAATYGGIVAKTSGGVVPKYIYYDQSYSSTSTGTINIYPTPGSGMTLFLNSWQQLQTFSSLSTTVLMPPGYQLFVETQFAMHLAAGSTPISAELRQMAKEAKAVIQATNLRDLVARIDYGARLGARSGLGTETNIYIDSDYIE